MSRSRKSFKEMDQGLIGLIGLVATAVLLAGALNIGKVSSLLGGQTYTAEFTEAGGLRSGDDVRIAGLKVGSVEDIELTPEHVRVTFRLGEVTLGDQSRASVKADNALGSKFLAIEPAGSGETTRIPVDRTHPGFSVNEELGTLTRHTGEIDARQLAASMRSLGHVLAETPEEFRGALAGVSALSETLSSRDRDLAVLLRKASSVSKLLADRNGEITSILADGSRLFHELKQRRVVLSQLLRNVRSAADQLNGLVDDNKTSLKPALQRILSTARLLTEYRGTLDLALKKTAGYVRSLGESVASGPFFHAYVANLTSPEDLIIGGTAGIIEQETGEFR